MATPLRGEAAASTRSLGELLHDLSDGTAELVRQEVRLAKTEVLESVRELTRGTTWVGVGIALAMCAAGAMIASLILALARYGLGGRTWLAALIVAVAFAVAGWLCVMRGINALTASRLAPRETATSIKETAEWLKHPTRSAAK